MLLLWCLVTDTDDWGNCEVTFMGGGGGEKTKLGVIVERCFNLSQDVFKDPTDVLQYKYIYVLRYFTGWHRVYENSIHRSHNIVYSKDKASVKTSGRCITQLAKTTIDPKFIELTADVFRKILSRAPHG